MVVGDVVEEMNLVLLKHETGGNRMHGRISPALVEEATVLVQGFEVIGVGLGAEPVQTADFEVGPLIGGLAETEPSKNEGVGLTKWQWL